MGCNRVRLRQQSRKKYPIIRNIPKYEYISNSNFEIESLIVELLETDTKTVIFDKPFSGAPSVIANFISNLPIPNVNVFVESISTSQVVIKISAPVTGQVHVQAMYIES